MYEVLAAAATMILLAGLLRYAFGGRETGGAMPSAGGDVGLLETVAVVPTREAAEILVARLARERVRVTVGEGEDGWRLLAFPGDADDVRVALRAL